MGHGIYLSELERKQLAKTLTTVVHCPTSNAPINENGLGSGLFDFKTAEKDGLNWVMGSDIGGGPFLSMFDVIRSFVSQNTKAKVKGATYIKGLYRSTLSGAEVLNIDKRKGNFSAGKEANFILVKTPKSSTYRNAEQLLEQIMSQCAKDRSLSLELVDATYFKGKLEFSKTD
jgi:guanine deaminase